MKLELNKAMRPQPDHMYTNQRQYGMHSRQKDSINYNRNNTIVGRSAGEENKRLRRRIISQLPAGWIASRIADTQNNREEK